MPNFFCGSYYEFYVSTKLLRKDNKPVLKRKILGRYFSPSNIFREFYPPPYDEFPIRKNTWKKNFEILTEEEFNSRDWDVFFNTAIRRLIPIYNKAIASNECFLEYHFRANKWNMYSSEDKIEKSVQLEYTKN